MEIPEILIKDYHYDLPTDRIAYVPLEQRDASKLLLYRHGNIFDDHFFHLSHHLPPGSLLVMNNTRVIEARIFFQKETGGLIEIFCLQPLGENIEESLSSTTTSTWQCLIGGASKWKPGQILSKDVLIKGQTVQLSARYISRTNDGFEIKFSWQPSAHSFAEVLHAAGAIPLPPYIKREATIEDSERYQTIFGKKEGSVAAPTASLHFTEKVFMELEKKQVTRDYITLHVGAGTFKPVKTDSVAHHTMHEEAFSITKELLFNLLHYNTIVAAGTTALRSLESIYWLGVKQLHGLNANGWSLQQWEAYELSKTYAAVTKEESIMAVLKYMDDNGRDVLHSHTSLLIVPGYQIRIPHALITNFHQPQSTLLLLVSAFIGEDWKKVYNHALANNYRFLSYGDSSLLWRRD